MRIEFAHLYVEKYSRYSRELILDFIKEDEFLFFRNRGDYTPEMHLLIGEFEPTMLLIHECGPTRKIKEGMMLVVCMDQLIRLVNTAHRVDENNQETAQYRARMVYGEIDNGVDFEKLIDDERTLITKNIPGTFFDRLAPTWHGSPCALKALCNKVELRVWNVGQGSTNSIEDEENLTLFDFGASIHYSKQKRDAIISNHEWLFLNKKQISLIISHWDSDHINLLCEVDDDFLRNICCVFYPPGILSMTAKQIAARIEKYCRFRVEISPKTRSIWNKCGIQRARSGDRYILYTGENSRESNQSGLLLAINSENATALLTADHTNYQVWNAVFHDAKVHNKRLHIVVPHHGGNCGRTAVQTVVTPGIAVISVGRNTYGHPSRSTVADYRRAGYTLLQTDIVGDDIVIHLI